jgi:prepilin-type N-terminal cleavage/methylation domain-containing protein
VIRTAVQPVARRHQPRHGFTLVEMLVSLAVLTVALTIIGVVFSVATKTTRQAAAYSEANNWVRQFMQQIEEDLRQCEPSQSVLVLVGRTQAAALTPDLLKAGRFHRVQVGKTQMSPEAAELTAAPPDGYSDPRADLLMFFTNRAMASQAPPADPNPVSDPFGYACRNGARFSPIEVVYGHAALDEPAFNPGSPPKYDWPAFGDERHIEETVDGSDNPQRLSIIPANHWHLGRRATILRGPTNRPPDVNDAEYHVGVTPYLARCQPYEDGGHMPGDGALFSLPMFLRLLGPESPNFVGGNASAICRPYYFPGGNPTWDGDVVDAINSLLYANGGESLHHVATVFENPPPELETNLGVHMLPGCAWFQVEFLMPEDPRNSVDYAPDSQWTGTFSKRYDLPLWTQVEPDQTYVFVPDTQANRTRIASELISLGGNGYRIDDFAGVVPFSPGDPRWDTVANRRIRLWPYAIRITVHVFDPDGRLEQPIVRSLVHRFD